MGNKESNEIESTETDENESSNKSDNEKPDPETATTSKQRDFDQKIKNDRSKRFEYLLKQTEIFSHFMTNQGLKSSANTQKTGRPKKKNDSHVDDSAAGEYKFFNPF